MRSERFSAKEQPVTKPTFEARWRDREPRRTKLLERQKSAREISRQRGQRLRRSRHAAPLVAGEAQGWCEARRLFRSKDCGCSQSFPEESEEAPQEVTMAMLFASSIA